MSVCLIHSYICILFSQAFFFFLGVCVWGVGGAGVGFSYTCFVADFDEAINNRSSSNTIDAFVEFWTSIRIGDWIHRCSSDFPRAEFSSALSIAALYVSVDACRLGIHAHSTSEEWSHAKPGYDTSYLQLVDWNTIEQKISFVHVHSFPIYLFHFFVTLSCLFNPS